MIINCGPTGQIGGQSLEAFDAWLATSSVPQSERASLRLMYQNALNTVNAEQSRLIGVIVNCPRNTLTANQLQAIPLDQLRAMANLAAQSTPTYQPPVLNDYSGMMPSFGLNNPPASPKLSVYSGGEPDDAPLVFNTMKWTDKADKDGTSGMALNELGQPYEPIMPPDGTEPEPMPTHGEMARFHEDRANQGLHRLANLMARSERGAIADPQSDPDDAPLNLRPMRFTDVMKESKS